MNNKELILKRLLEANHISLEELFIENAVGVKTSRDTFAISNSHSELSQNINFLFNSNKSEIEKKYNIKFNTIWSLEKILTNVDEDKLEKDICAINYRPFDYRYIVYNDFIIDRGCFENSEASSFFLQEQLNQFKFFYIKSPRGR